jgi:hypothetical protein
MLNTTHRAHTFLALIILPVAGEQACKPNQALPRQLFFIFALGPERPRERSTQVTLELVPVLSGLRN